MITSKFKSLIVAIMLLVVGGIVQTAAAAGPRKAWSESDGVYYLKTTDGQEDTYAVDSTLTFKAVAEGNTIPSYRDCGVVFKPAKEGNILRITVNSIDLSGSNYLLLYDGAVSGIGASDYSRTGKQSKYLPDGWVKWYDSTSAGETYTSTAADGSLSFGFHSASSNGQKGFSITVTSIPAKDMVYKGMELIGNPDGVNRGAKNQILLGVNVMTEGSKNPEKLNNLKIDCAALAGNANVANLRLYKSANFIDVNIVAKAAVTGDALEAKDVTLKQGNNYFYVVADVDPDASGTVPGPKVATLQVGGESKSVTNPVGDDVTVNNVILMTADATTFKIGDDVLWYDDGGKDGKIGSNFTGTITFVPATAGQCVKVDFNKFAIFNTSSVGYNDEFKFYNGRTADESQLITTLLKEGKTVKSTAADGSMTVTLKSTTGVPADGWEAVVSQFLPGDMTFKSIDATASSTETVAAGDTLQQLLLIDVVTTNTSKALHASQFNFTADTKNIDQVKLYYLGESAATPLGSDNYFGKAAVSGSTVAVTGDRALTEGHNYFAALVDVKETALNGATVSLKLDDATIGGTVHTPAALTATRTVANTCYASQGAHAHKIYDTWTFFNAKNPYSDNKYETEDADYIVTFTPGVPGAVAQLDFSAFDVYYASSSYGTRAVFEVYSGDSLSEANLLWKLENNSQSTTGPGKILRSNAANGAITVKFNPKTTSSYYAGKGWTATVTPFVNHDMTIDSVKVNQSSTDVVAAGSTDAKIIDFDVVTEGTLTLKTVKTLNLDLKDSYPNVARVNVKYNNSPDYTTAVDFGSLANPTQNQVAVTGNRILNDGDNYFWVTYDLKSDAEANAVLDAKLVSIVDATETTVVSNGDPDGSRILKYIVNMETGSKVVTVNNPIMFYDDGGADGNTSKGFDGTVTFVPGKEGSAVQLETKSFSCGQGKFYLYNGSKVDDNNLVGTYNYTSGPDTYISKAADGALTVRYTGPTSSYSTYDGFAIEMSLHKLASFTVDTVKAEPGTHDSVVRGSRNAVLQKIAVVVSGDRGAVKLNNFKFVATGTSNLADIKAAKLYYTAKAANFVDNCLVAKISAVNSENVLAADSAVSITGNGTYYFWITYDIADDATAGNRVAASLQGVDVDGAYVAATTIAAQRTVNTGLKGTYIIGSSNKANYATFADATSALADGIEGPVTFVVEPGTYAENVEINAVQGVSAEHPLSFVGQSGNASDVVIKGAGYSTPDYGEFKKGMFFVDSTSYVTIKHMSFIPDDQTYPAVLHIYNQSRHVTVDSIVVKATPVTASNGYNGISLILSQAVNEDGKNNDFLTVTNSTFSGGYVALYLGGTSYVALTREQGLVVKNNIIDEAGSKGIYVTDEDNTLIDGNAIYQSTTSKSGYHGIDLFRNRGNVIVSNNKITNAHSAYSYGIELRQTCYGASTAEPILVYNNSISITNSPSSSTAGIEIDGDNKNIALYYNTVRVAGSQGYTFYAARARSNESFDGILLQNNLMQNLTGSASNMSFNGNYAGKTTFLNNAFNAGNIVAGTDSAAFATMAGNATNVVDSAQFVSETDLHLKAIGSLKAAAPVALVTTDLDGTMRDAVTPTIGAYEYRDIVVEHPQLAQGYPVVAAVDQTSADVKTKWNVSGKLYAKAVKAGSISPIAKKAAAKVTVDDVMTSGTAVDYTAGTELTTHFSSLAPASSYKAYFVLVSALDSSKSALAECEFATQVKYDTLKVDLTSIYDMVSAGDSTTIEPVVTGGKKPYTYEWRDQMNQVIGTDSAVTVAPAYTYGYKLTVTSADNKKVVAKTAVYVMGQAVAATFDDNYLAPDSYFDGDNDDDVYYSGSYAFHVAHHGTNWYDGYAMSNKTSTAFSGLDDMWNSAVGQGVDNSGNYAVYYPAYGSDSYIEVTNDLDGDVIKGTWVALSAYTKKAVTDGVYGAKKFAAGDWLKVTAKGVDAQGATTSTDLYLIDFRSQDETQHTMLDNWYWWDLSSLGKVVKVSFSFTGSDTGVYGLNTPSFACFDNFNDQSHLSTSIANVSHSTAAKVTVANGAITVEGAQHVAVYTAAGAQVSAGKAVTSVVPGIYLVVADGHATKVVVR